MSDQKSKPKFSNAIRAEGVVWLNTKTGARTPVERVEINFVNKPDASQKPIKLSDLDTAFTATFALEDDRLWHWFMALYYWHKYRVSMN